MNGDERFDALLRTALEWQAGEAARRAPSMEQSVQRVAERLAMKPERARPLIEVRAGTGRGLQLIVVLLLLALAALAIASGAAQLFLRPPLEPPRFGYAGACFTPDQDGIVYAASVDDQPLVLYEDGRLIQLLSAAGETRSAILDTAGGLERRLSGRGIALVLARVAETIPEPGCRHLRAAASTGEISVFTPAGLIELSWHPSNNGRRLTPEEEADAEALELALAEPETWLPADAWQAAAAERVAPERFVVIVEVTPSGFAPGDDVPLSTGGVLEGSDPRYARVVLPGGEGPADFGDPVAVRDSTVVRCGVLEAADARQLSDSLDALPLAMHDEEELFTEDLVSRVFIYVATAYPEEPDCVEHGRQMEAGANPSQSPPAPTPGPGDDLAGVDPCSLLPTSVDEMFGPDTARERRGSNLALGAPAESCDLVTPAEFSPGTLHATLTLYPRSLPEESAAALALSVLGGGLVQDSIAGRPVWINECLAATMPCAGAIAAWSDRYFLVVEFDRGFGGEPSTTSLATARSIVEAVLSNRSDWGRS